MSSTSFRTDAPRPPPLPPPPAPPLPPQRYGARAATAIARLAQPFFYGSRPPSAHGHRDDEPRSAQVRAGIPRIASRTTSHSLVHKTGIPISALDISPDRAHAVLAGRDILKTIQIQGGACAEDFNLRSTIIAYASTHNASRGVIPAQHKDQLAANDVKWSHGKFDTTIATAAANGRIVLYDINRAGVELARLHEHTRQVHRVAFNPYQGALLLSGSQDGTIRMWDVRDLAGERSVMTCRSINRFSGNNEGIRDLRWSPTDGVEFAAGTDNGVIQRWDFRKENAPFLKINAHDKTCHSVDWHPSGKYLASAGSDKNVKVWDFKSSDRRIKPSWQLRAPQAVLNVRWRPAYDLSDAEGLSEQQCTYLATSYDQSDPRIHIWDFRRPHVPFQEIDRYETPATDILWCSEDLLWFVGITGMFTQIDIKYATKPIERRNINVVTAAPDGRICYFSKARARRPMSFPEPSKGFLHRSNTRGSSGDKFGDKFGSSHSATDGSLEEASILNSSLKKRRQKTLSARTTASATAGTPPSIGSSMPAARLEEAMKPESRFSPDQVAACGHLLGVFDGDAFTYLARHYRPPFPLKELPHISVIPELVSTTFEENALVAARTGQYRLAQSWRMMALAVRTELEGRDEISYKRLDILPNITENIHVSSSGEVNTDEFEVIKGEKLTSSPHRLPAASNLESTSNMPTPLAKPIRHLVPFTTVDEELVLDTKGPGQLPGPAWRTKQMIDSQGGATQIGNKANVHGSSTPHEYEEWRSLGSSSPDVPVIFGSFTEMDEQMHERRAALNNYRAKPRSPLRLDEPLGVDRGLSVVPRFNRHDSNESFQMFSASTDSNPHSLPMVGSFEDSQSSNLSDPILGTWESDLTKGLSHQTEHPADKKGKGGENVALFAVNTAPDESENPDSDRPFALIDGVSAIRRPTIPILPIIHRTSAQPYSGKSNLGNSHEDKDSVSKLWSTTFSSPENPLPWSATALIPLLLDFHLNTLSDTQLPAFLSLYLAPLFPYLFNVNAVTTVLLSYHQQLVSLNLCIEAATLRNYCFPTYTSIWERGTGDHRAAGWYCNNCKRAVKGDTIGYCMRCKQDWGLCPICESSKAPLPFSGNLGKDEAEGLRMVSDTHGTKLWAWCQECGHGGHSSCLRLWWVDAVRSEGGCPSQGCLHDCMPGPRRNERLREKEVEGRRAKMKAGGVVKDGWVVGESRAVERARGLVAQTDKAPDVGQSTRALSGKDGELSAGLGSGGKRVRLVEPSAEGNLVDGSGVDDAGMADETSKSVP